ncbi:MAG: hypothetical protein ABQ298_03965 [Puniceicoccaceae bacterium]
MRIHSTLLSVTFALAALLPQSTILGAGDRVIVVSSASGHSAGLDLNAVGEIFQASNDLQHFEQQLNDPDLLLNNLDLNEDGQVDFLRVLEQETDSGRMIVIQAILGENAFTDVAYIDIQQESVGQYQVQIRGESTLYGSRSYYLPRYRTVSWPILVDLWAPGYSFYSSPYSWRTYPSWYRPYSCVRVGFYRSRIAYRYPKPYFHFSYRAGLSKFHHHPHHSHRPYREFRKHRDYGYHPGFRPREHHDRFNRNDFHSRFPARGMNPRVDERERSYRTFQSEPRQWSADRIQRLRPDPEHRARPESPAIRQERMNRNAENTPPRILPRPSERSRPHIEPRNTFSPRTGEPRQLSPRTPRSDASMNLRTLPTPRPSKPTAWTPPQPSRPTHTFRESRVSSPSRPHFDRPRSDIRSGQPRHRESGPPTPGRSRDR